jgi:hypothetical protein
LVKQGFFFFSGIRAKNNISMPTNKIIFSTDGVTDSVNKIANSLQLIVESKSRISLT